MKANEGLQKLRSFTIREHDDLNENLCRIHLEIGGRRFRGHGLQCFYESNSFQEMISA
jgi:hypothetical protein